MMMSQKSGFTSIGLWNILNLLGKIPKVITVRLTLLTHPVRMRPIFRAYRGLSVNGLLKMTINTILLN